MGTLNIGYISDQYLPRTSTDTEQITSMISAFGLNGNSVTLVIPVKKYSNTQTAEQLASYYAVEQTFTVSRHLVRLPLLRGVVKIWHALKTACSGGISSHFDVIYTRNLPVVLAYLTFTNKPVVYETYRNWPDQNRSLIPVFKFMETQKNFVGIVTHSKLAANSYKRIGFNEDRLLVAHNGIWPGRFSQKKSVQEARKKLGIHSDAMVATYAGRVNTNKGLDIVLELAKKFPPINFWIIGSEKEGEIEKRARQISNIDVFPWQPIACLPDYLFASDILIIPPSSKPLEEVGNTVLPMKTFMYMAAEKAIFAPRNPDITEVLKHGYNAILSDTDDFRHIVKEFSRLISDEELRFSLASQAYQDVMELSWEKRAENIEKFIEERIEQIN